MGTAQPQLDEESLVRETIAAVKLPEGVKFKRVEQTTDWTGDPCFRIYLSVSKRRSHTPRAIRELSRTTDKITADILSLRLGKFPFITLEEAR